MNLHAPGPRGLVGRLFAILLMAVVIEFAVGTLIYERASHLSLQDDEAKRLAEHLVIARKLVGERPPRERGHMAGLLTTDRYEVAWSPEQLAPPALSPNAARMREQVVAWEPSLNAANLRLRVTSLGRKSSVTGGLQLTDGGWLLFSMRDVTGGWAITAGRIGLMLVPAIALVVAGGLLIRRTLSPLRHLAEAAERVGIREPVAFQEEGTPEVRNLIRSFNEMQERIKRLIAERTEMLAAVGHDLRTPIARLQLRLDQVADVEQRDAMEADLAEMGSMVASLLAYLGGEADPEKTVRIDIAVMAATLVDEYVDLGRDATYDGVEHLEWCLRPTAMRRAVGNLLENALHYGESAQVRVQKTGNGFTIMVEDDGPGIPPDKIDTVLRPFTRLDTARQRNTKGLGLGLAIVSRTVEREGGSLSLANRPEGGLRATITIPREA